MLAIPPPCGPPRWTRLPEGIDGWLVTRYADARAVLGDTRFVRDPARLARLRAATGLPVRHGGERVGRGAALLHLDPPEHTRLRRTVNPIFAARQAESYGPTIDALATTLVERCVGSGRADLVSDLAVPLAVGVLCQVTGLPVSDYARFGRSVRQIHRIDGGTEAGQRTIEAIVALDRYLEARIAEGPPPGVLAALATRLSEDEVMALGRDLLVGGYESTANLISGGLALLLAEPSRYDEVRRDHALVDAAVEECLRHVAPFPELQARYAAEPVEVGGTLVSPGEPVVVNVAAANRDPARFTAAERWSWEEPGGHLSFGHGAHHCVGAVLARREANAAFRAVIAGFDDLRLGCSPCELEWEPGLTPSLRSLPVRFTPRIRG